MHLPCAIHVVYGLIDLCRWKIAKNDVNRDDSSISLMNSKFAYFYKLNMTAHYIDANSTNISLLL